MAYVIFSGTITGDSFGITSDYLPGEEFTVLNGAQLDLIPATIPKPESWAMMLGGLGTVAIISRRWKFRRGGAKVSLSSKR